MLLFWEKTCSMLGKTCSVFGENRLRFWDKLAPCLRKTNSNFGTTGSVLGWKLARFLDWLGTKLKSRCFERYVWVWIFEVLGLGVTKNKSTGGKLEG